MDGHPHGSAGTYRGAQGTRDIEVAATPFAPMRDLATFTTGPDGTVVLAPTPRGAYDYEDIEVDLSGRTIELHTPSGGQEIALEVVHGDLDKG